MARLVAAFGSSHSVMLTSELEDWISGFRGRDHKLPLYDHDGNPCTYEDHLARAPARAAELVSPSAITRRFEATQAAMSRMREEIVSARLDALIIVGDDQHELFHDEHMPAIAVYYGETIRNAARTSVPDGDWYKRAQMRRLEENGDVHYPCHSALALHLIDGLNARDFDIAAAKNLTEGQYEGHAYSFVHRRYLAGALVPVVPIFLNTYNWPNQPRPRRCVDLGTAMRAVIASFPGDIRIGLLASGGLSHFLVEEDLDQAIIDAAQRKDIEFLASLDPRRLQAGSSEIRNWIVVASAALNLDLSWVSYIPAYRTPALTGTGLCFAKWS
jgi:3-O-methylgallate 3,4-dioxygenase